METDSIPGKESLQPDAHPLRRDIHSPGTWRYLINYPLLGSSAFLLLIHMIGNGAWWEILGAVIGICLAMTNLAAMQAAERKGSRSR